ncbi:3-phosphoserine/phosphohydroxythreonine transaminase [Lacticaseibacillus baoqingensis]|uniref:Phosphoserine aminotransferase n=1 Tax=Lacticaseibacillus baoqingensis TaxID=2486013 RepID=A0ABW4E8T2_9LACO|nr:3-phosphoserine/phosphohydroxythreonine transaminase [Lacticaseibacillus baoqingensis]
MVVYNFAAGPAMMPQPVVTQIQAELPSLGGSGMSIMEVSHRAAAFGVIINQAETRLRTLMAIPDDYAVLFMQGGGTGQFAAAPLNLATNHRRIAVLDSGQWASRAAGEAARLGVAADVLATTKNAHYRHLPPLPPIAAATYDYLHLCINNTVEGTTYHHLPDAGSTPIVGDMSSNILAEQYHVRDFGLIFAGAQKNLGPAGVTVVIVRREWLHAVTAVPSMLDYRLFDQKKSLYNTPPVFAIYALNLVLQWVQEQGGVAEMQRRNEIKAKKLYAFLDESPVFANLVAKADRSLTNVVFNTGSEALDQAVVAQAAAHGLMNLKGHRSVGGLRASLYNAMPLAGVDALIDFLHDFEKHL